MGINMSWGSSVAERQDRNLEGGGSTPSPSTIAGHQPVYLPGIAVMAKIALADIFMWVGHCDYQPRSFHSRNYIWGRQGPLLLSVPIDYYSGPSINEKRINGQRWVGHQLKSIEHAYVRRPHFYEYFPALQREMIAGAENGSLAYLNTSLVALFCQWLNIKTPVLFSEQYNIGLYPGNATKMLAEICTKTGANHYLSSPGESAYIDLREMNGFAHSYLKFKHPVYDQGHKVFMPNLSVIDLVFNCGPESGTIVRGAHE